MVICLSSSYVGDEFKNCYAINPVDGKEIDIDVELSLSPDDIQATYNYEKIPQGSVEAAFDKVIPAGMTASYEKEKSRILKQAVKYAFINCGAKEGEMLMLEHIKKLPSLIMEKLEPFLLH